MTNPAADAVADHLRGLSRAADRVAAELAAAIAGVADVVAAQLEAGGKLLFCGNGGSAADAQHLATEYVVRFRNDRRPIAALALTTDSSLLTAAANDLGFEHVFARQIEALASPGDLLFLHSTSGASPNLLRAADAARRSGVVTVALLARGGGALRDRVDHALVLPVENAAHAQELHIAIGHAICALVEQRIGSGAAIATPPPRRGNAAQAAARRK